MSDAESTDTDAAPEPEGGDAFVLLDEAEIALPEPADVVVMEDGESALFRPAPPLEELISDTGGDGGMAWDAIAGLDGPAPDAASTADAFPALDLFAAPPVAIVVDDGSPGPFVA